MQLDPHIQAITWTQRSSLFSETVHLGPQTAQLVLDSCLYPYVLFLPRSNLISYRFCLSGNVVKDSRLLVISLLQLVLELVLCLVRITELVQKFYLRFHLRDFGHCVFYRRLNLLANVVA